MMPPCYWPTPGRRDVLEHHEGDVEGVAEADEARALHRGVDVEDPGQHGRLVGHDTHRMTAQVGEAREDVAGEVGRHLVEDAVVDDPLYDIMHVIGLVGVVRYDL